MNAPWVADAKCADAPTEMFFPTSKDSGAAHDAKVMCASCPVRTQCLAESLSVPDLYGIWAGFNQEERRRLKYDDCRITHCPGCELPTVVYKNGRAPYCSHLCRSRGPVKVAS